jgi:hypothetical protein
MTGRGSYIAAFVIFATSFTFFSSYMDYGLAYDEGYLLDGVEKIMGRQVIYRDFSQAYAPGRFYLIAAAFKIFGKNILAERFIFALFQAIKCSLAFLIVRAVIGNGFAYLAPLLIMIAPGPWHKVFFSSSGFLATYAVMASISTSRKRFFLSGAALGLCAVFRQDVAVFAVAGLIIALLIENLAHGRRLNTVLPRTTLLLAGASVVVVPVVVYFIRHGALGAMLRELLVEGMRENMANPRHFPGLAARTGVDLKYLMYVLPLKILFYLPLVIYGVSLSVIAGHLMRRSWSERQTHFVIVFVVSILAFNQSIWRSDIGHMLQTMQYVYLLIAAVLGVGYSYLVRSRALGTYKRVLVKYAVFAAIPLFLLWVTLIPVAASRDRAVFAKICDEGRLVGNRCEYIGSMLTRAVNTTKLEFDRAPVYVTDDDASFLSRLKEFIDKRTSPGEYVLATPQFPLFYFLFDRRNPTRYAHYRRRMDPAAERQYVDDILSHETDYIVLTEPHERAKPGRSESFSEYASSVREWLFENYKLVRPIRKVKILRRKRPADRS